MNFVQLVGRLRRKCRVNGTNPTALANQSEEINRLADWINEAWMEIQLKKPDWEWMRSSFSFTTTNAKTSYSATEAGIAAGTFANWKRDSLRNYVTATGLGSETPMAYIPYEKWRDTYLFGANRSVYSRPNEYTFAPDKTLAFGPITAAGYTVLGDYYTVATELVADADIPSLPVQYHMAIVYRAMMFYGESEAASEVYQGGHEGYDLMMDLLGLDRMPEIQLGGALA